MLRKRIEIGVDAPKLVIAELPGDLKIAAGEAGAILVSAELKDACAGGDQPFASAGSATLKGFAEPVELFAPT